ncbi:hypothetical protein [Streptomyces sp. NPDC057682]|uniref:hypothetical protein n=1 Tax=Streptomyces sp. NPDC057682 TaxID=3346210 RepID=UPI0036849BA6
MTDPRPSLRVLSLYPRGYRARHGAEILEMYRAATADASPAARRRERLDIAAHAVRVRTRTGADRPAGRFLVAVAPYALAAAAAISAAGPTVAVSRALHGGPGPGLPGTALCTAVLVAGVPALLGSWPAARGTAALCLVALVAGVPGSAWLLPLLALVAAMPPAVAPAGRDGRLAGAFAVMTWLPSLCSALSGGHVGFGLVQQIGPTMLLLALRAAAPDVRPRHLLAILVAGAPWAASPTGSPAGALVVAVALGLAWTGGRLSRGGTPAVG